MPIVTSLAPNPYVMPDHASKATEFHNIYSVRFLRSLFAIHFLILYFFIFPAGFINMVEEPNQKWDEGEKSGLVSIGDHSLYVAVAGPDRKQNEPVVILMQGLGSTINEWVGVRRLVTPFARFLCYDRSGMGKSESYPNPPKAITSVAVAQELDTLLKNINFAPPYIVVCHSWGGILSREFLHLRRGDVVGMVFVDANQETSFEHPEDWPYPYFATMSEGVDQWVAGEREDHVLSKEEFAAIEQEETKPRHHETRTAELEGFKTCFPVLAAKNQLETHALGNHPISVIHGLYTGRDLRLTLEAGIRRGNGTEKDREDSRNFCEEWEENSGTRMKEITKLSSDPMLRYYRDSTKSGHDVQLLEPELIVEEIKRVYDYEVKRTS